MGKLTPLQAYRSVARKSGYTPFQLWYGMKLVNPEMSPIDHCDGYLPLLRLLERFESKWQALQEPPPVGPYCRRLHG